MKKIFIIFFLLLCGEITLGQNITVDDTTPFAACGGQNITVNFTPTGGATGPFTVELIEYFSNQGGYYCGPPQNTTTVKSSVATSTNSAILNIPTGLNAFYGNTGPPNYCNQQRYYVIKIKNATISSTDFSIGLTSTCSPVISPRIVPSQLCAGKVGIVKWVSSGANTGNIFTVEMSNSSGSFTSPISLGTLSSDNTDGIKNFSATIPSNTTSGSGYLIKVKSSDPVSEKTFGFTVNSATICGPVQTPTVSLPICSGSTQTVSYVLDGVFQSGNVFTAELSDQNGSFASPTVIGSITSQTATSFLVAIPSGLSYSSSYLIRVKASLPSSGTAYTGPNTPSFTVGLLPLTINNSQTSCQYSPLSIEFYSGFYFPKSSFTFVWKKDGVNVNANNQNINTSPSYEYYYRSASQSTDAGVYNVTVTRISDGCSVISNNNTVTVNSAPNPPSTSPVTVINGNTTSLTASGCAGDIYWYNALTGGSFLTNGTFTTPELSQQTTYYAACYTNCSSLRTPLVVSIDATNAPNAPTLTASDNNFCNGSVASPKLTATGCSGIVRWYYKYNLTDTQFYLQETDNAAPYEFNISNSTTRYYAADCRVNGVLSTSKTEILITVKPVPSPPSVSPNGSSANNGSTLTLNAFNCNGTVKWYDNSTTTTVLSTANPFITPVLVNNVASTTEYYQLYYTCTVDGCESSYRDNSTYYIYNSIQSPSFSFANNNSNVCSGNSKIINAHGCSNGTVNWYDASSNGNLLGTGFSYTTPVLTYNNSNNSYNYYADCTIGANTSSRNNAYVYVNRQPTTPSANQPTIACNATATLTATGCNTNSPEYFSIYWYANTTTQSSFNSGSAYTTPNLSATTTYYVECVGGGGCKSARVPITVTVACTPPDAPVIASSQTVCAGIGVGLTATGCAGTVNWSDGGVGTSRSNVIYGATTSLSATCSVGNLSSGASNVITITINPKPNLVIANPATVAPPATVNITVPAVTVGSTLPSGTVLSYHTNMAGNITLPNPTTIAVSNTYYIKATSTAGCSDIKPVIVTINDCSTPLTLVSTADDYSSGVQLKKTNETINAKNKVTNTAQTTYRSNKSILLEAGTVGNPGFKANPTSGGYFKAEIGGCN